MELLIRVVDRVSDDPVRHHQLTKCGDVIAYQPDGGPWGIEDLRNPDWRIVRVPGLAEAEARALVGEELPRGPAAHECLLRPRGMRVDPGPLGLDPVARERPYPDATVDADTFRPAMSLKDPLPHPDLVGPVTSPTIG